MVAALATTARTQRPEPAPTATGVEVVLRGEASGGSVEFGKPFELDVVRRWGAGSAPPPWSSQVLLPLVVAELGVDTTTTGGEVVETRRFRAQAFQRGAVTLLPRTEATRTLLVDSCLPGGDAGVLELPPTPALEIRAVRRTLAQAMGVGLASFLVAFGVQGWLRAVRRRRERVPLRVRLSRELAVLEARAPTSPAEARSEAIAATLVLREAEQRRQAAQPEPSAEAVAAVDRLLDDVKFADRTLSPLERAQLLGVLRALVAALPEDAA